MIKIDGVTQRQNKKGTSYRIRVFTGRDADGKEKFASETWTPPKQGLSEKKLVALIQAEKVRFKQEVENGLYTDSRQTLKDFCKDYLEITKTTLSPTTHRAYQAVIEQYIIPALGHLKLRDIKPLHVQKFVQQLQEPIKRNRNERYKGHEQQPEDDRYLSPGTVKKYYSVLQSVLARACKLGLIPSNPADSDRIDLPKNRQKDVEIFTVEEANKMLDCLREEPEQYQLLVHLAIITGARRGELMALKWENVHLEEKQIDIVLSSYKLKGERVQFKEPKSKSSRRSLAIPDYLCDMLREHRRQQMLEADKLGDAWKNTDGWIFTQWDGMPMNPDTPSSWFAKFLRAHSLPHRKFHALRHTSATLLLDKGANIKAVSSRLGHAQLSTTNIYLHGLQSADIAAADTLGELFSPQSKSGTDTKTG